MESTKEVEILHYKYNVWNHLSFFNNIIIAQGGNRHVISPFCNFYTIPRYLTYSLK